MEKFLIVETIYSEKHITARLGTTAQKYGNAEVGKAVKLTAESRYELCEAGDAIEGIISSSNLDAQGTQDGYAIGGVVGKGYKAVTFGGACAVGDYVVVHAPVAFGTKLTEPLRVAKAADQAVAKAAPFKARVVSLGEVGSGAVGTTGTIEML